MKKYIFALLGALAMTLIPQNVNAANGCEITVASGETKTINYYLSSVNDRKDCHITNFGTLNIKSGASIYADTDYAINNRGGTVNITGGSISSAIHQAIWSKGGTINISGASLSSAGGFEENIVFVADGALNLCGNYSYKTDNGANLAVKNTCQASAKTQATVREENKETITITVTTREKASAQNTNTQSAAAKSTPKTSTPSSSTAQPEPTTTESEETTPEETPTKTEANEETKNAPETKAAAAASEEMLPEAGESKNNNTIAIIIAATIATLGTASTVVLINRLRA